jgi:hypothetical protein
LATSTAWAVQVHAEDVFRQHVQRGVGHLFGNIGGRVEQQSRAAAAVGLGAAAGLVVLTVGPDQRIESTEQEGARTHVRVEHLQVPEFTNFGVSSRVLPIAEQGGGFGQYGFDRNSAATGCPVSAERPLEIRRPKPENGPIRWAAPAPAWQ